MQFADIEHLPKKDTYRTIINVRGKETKDRTMPIRETLAKVIEAWRMRLVIMG